MSYYTCSLSVKARLSRHNDERDERDDALWEQLQERILQLVEDPAFAEIEPWVD